MPLDSDEDLTISDKVLLHLFNYRKHYDDYFVPFAVVQGGIAAALSVYRSEVSRTIKKLKDQGHVEEKITHVEGIKRRRKAYFLTASGSSLASRLSEKVKARKIILKTKEGEKRVELGEVPKHLDMKLSTLDIVNFLTKDTLDLESLTKKEEAEPPPKVYGSEMIGRENELGSLKNLIDKLKKGIGQSVVITGEAGIGKTRLVNELRNLCHDLNFLEGSCLYQTGADPYLPFLDVINSYIERTNSLTIKEKLSREIGATGLGSVLLQSEESSDMGGKLEYERIRIFEYITNTIITISKDKPTVIFIDDIHWADAGTIHLFHYLSRNIKANPIMIIGAYRPEEIGLDVEHPLHEVLQRMRKENLIEEIGLDRLSKKETSAMISSFLKRGDPPKNFVTTIFKETNGNPFFIEEVLNSLEEEDLIGYSKDEWTFPRKIMIPSSVRETLHRRLNKLNKNDRNVLDVAAVIGDRFDLDVLLEVLGNEEAILDSIERLRKAHLIEESEGERELYRFHHDKISEVVYNELSKPKLRFLHKRIGETLEMIHKDSLTDMVTDLAYHFSRTNEFQKAYDYSLKAAEKAEKLYSYEEAISFYENALDAIDSMRSAHKTDDLADLPKEDAQWGPEDILDKDFFEEALNPNIYLKNRKAEVLLKLGDAYGRIALLEESRKHYEDALLLTKDVRRRALIYGQIGKVLMRMGHYEEGLKYCKKALEWLKGIEGEEKALIHHTMGLIYFSKGSIDKALEFSEKGLEIMKRLEDDKGVATLLNTLGILYHHKGNYKKSIEAFNKSVDIRQARGYERGLASNYNNIGNHYLKMGDYNKALENYKMGAELFEKMKDLLGLGKIHNNMGLIYQRKKEYDKALEHYERGLETTEKTGDSHGISIITTNIGELYRLKKDYDKALEYFERGMESCKKMGFELELIDTYIGLAEVYLEKNELEDALGNISEGMKLAKRSGMLGLLALALRIAGMIYREKGDFKNAKERFEESIELYKKFENELELGRTYYEYGLMSKKKKDGKRAEKLFGDASSLLGKFKDDYNAAQIMKELGKSKAR
jgi:predicted ATPase